LGGATRRNSGGGVNKTVTLTKVKMNTTTTIL
jgi:hypothetical protein